MANSDTNRISAASGMMLNNHRIAKQNRSPRALGTSQAIQDTLETSDGDASNTPTIYRNGDESSEIVAARDSVLPGDFLDISG